MTEYIDKSLLRQKMYHEAFETDTDLQRWDSGCWIRYKLFENCLDDIPAADVRPVVQGEWVKNSDRVGWHCSCCKVDNYYAYSWNSDTGKNEFQDKYCPNCGADMRGANDD